MSNQPFVTKTITTIGEYNAPEAPPTLVEENATNVKRHNLFETKAPNHTRNYMLGLDVLSWNDSTGAERSQLIINQKAGSLVVPWEQRQEGDGIWIYLQETRRNPHAVNGEDMKEVLESSHYNQLGVWSLEAPAGGLNYEDGHLVEDPVEAAIREVREETGIQISTDELVELIPGGLQIGSDINTKRSYLFAADISSSSWEASEQAIEYDEKMGNLIAFCVRSLADLRELTSKTRMHSDTTSALALLALQPNIYRFINK